MTGNNPKQRIEITSTVDGTRFSLGNVLGHVGKYLAKIRSESHVHVGHPGLKHESTLDIEPFVISCWNNLKGGMDPLRVFQHRLLDGQDSRPSKFVRKA